MERNYAATWLSNCFVSIPSLNCILPIDWIEEKLTELSDVLEQNTAQSAEALCQVLGQIRMEATYPETGKPYYTAHTSNDTLAIIDKPAYSESSQKSSDTLRWWARSQYRRTLYQLPLQITIYDPSEQPSYQNIAEKALQLKDLGLNYSSIARQLEVNHKTVSKAIEWISEFENKCI